MDFEEIIQELDSLPREIQTRNQGTEDSLYEALLLLLSTLAFTDGNIDQSEENFAKIASLRPRIERLVAESGYSDTIAYYQDRLAAVQRKIDEIVDTSDISDETMASLREGADAAEASALESLNGAMNEAVSDIVNTIVFMMLAGSTRAALEDAIAEAVRGTASKLGVISANLNVKFDVVFTAMVRSYAMYLYLAKGFNKFRYEGGLIADSRPFCVERNGNVYEYNEVADWADLPDWRGRMPGTNRQTIFFYLGGYRCRHWLVPVTQES